MGIRELALQSKHIYICNAPIISITSGICWIFNGEKWFSDPKNKKKLTKSIQHQHTCVKMRNTRHMTIPMTPHTTHTGKLQLPSPSIPFNNLEKFCRFGQIFNQYLMASYLIQVNSNTDCFVAPTAPFWPGGLLSSSFVGATSLREFNTRTIIRMYYYYAY